VPLSVVSFLKRLDVSGKVADAKFCAGDAVVPHRAEHHAPDRHVLRSMRRHLHVTVDGAENLKFGKLSGIPFGELCQVRRCGFQRGTGRSIALPALAVTRAQYARYISLPDEDEVRRAGPFRIAVWLSSDAAKVAPNTRIEAGVFAFSTVPELKLSRICTAIIRGELSPPKPTPSSPVGGEVVFVNAPNPTWVPGLPGMPAFIVRQRKIDGSAG